MTTYTAINIGPIVSTLQMARKPRELWAASYLFSFLMECIYEEIKKTEETKIISPSKPSKSQSEVGLYPDRIYFKGEIDADEKIKSACYVFFEKLLAKREVVDLNYFNIMTTSCEATHESDAIEKLNHQLDVMELCNYAADGQASQTIYNIISKRANSPLFQLATGEDKFFVPDLETIARREFDAFRVKQMKSHHKYFCIVVADGDNVGKTVSHPELSGVQLKKISDGLMYFGDKATELIKDFGGLPIYAGGDDLLFIAPVKGVDGTNIFEFLKKIEDVAFKNVHDAIKDCELNDNGKPIEASLSFGISITYYKYPLYEALETARNLLFGVAKNIKDKKAWAWSLRNHSGDSFDVAFSRKDETLQKLFLALIEAITDDDLVSAVAHKIYQKDDLSNMVLDSESEARLDALFNNILEFKDNSYFKTVKELMPELFEAVDSDIYTTKLYSLLRTAKFIKGEDLHDE